MFLHLCMSLMSCLKCMARPLCQEGANTWVSCTSACSLQTHTSVLPETRSYISFFVLYYVCLTKRKFRVRLWGLFFSVVCASWSKPDPDTCMNSADCSHSDILLTLCNLCCLCNNWPMIFPVAVRKVSALRIFT